MRKVWLWVISIVLVPTALLFAGALLYGLAYLIDNVTKRIGTVPDTCGVAIVLAVIVVAVYISGVPAGIYDYIASFFRRYKK